VKDAGNGAKGYAKAKEFLRQWWIWFINKEIRFSNKPRPHKEPESPIDKAVRRTAFATILIAIFTVVLAGVGYLQYIEIRDSGVESSGQMNQMIHEYRSQVGQLKRQAGDTHDLAAQAKNQADRTKDMADRMKDQADRTKVIATQAVVQANAAKSAADTAVQTLHISERAYIVAGQPAMDMAAKNIILPIVNSGRIPSGKVRGVVHEAALPVTNPENRGIKVFATEFHWKHYEFESVPTTGVTQNFNIAIPALNSEDLNSGHQQIIIVGVITYNDGFPGDADQQWLFCYGNALLPLSKSLQWFICDPNLYLAEAIEADHYPENESK
jgi:hypothetical protein